MEKTTKMDLPRVDTRTINQLKRNDDVSFLEMEKQISEFINAHNAAIFIRKYGIPMSKSRLYKLTSSFGIPFYKAGSRLIFRNDELAKWCEDEIHQALPTILSNKSIIKTAQNKL